MKHLKLFETFSLYEYDATKKLYHVSRTENRSKIESNGLGKGSDGARYPSISGDYRYFWTHYKMAFWYAATESRDFEESYDIYEVEVDETCELHEDPTLHMDYAVRTKATIEPSQMSYLETVKYNPKNKSHRKSLDYIMDEIADEEWD